MKVITIPLATFLLIILLSTAQQIGIAGESVSKFVNPFQSEYSKKLLASCLTNKGFVVYESVTCSDCRAQRKLFGKAFEYITAIECNPIVPEHQTDRCLQMEIWKTPTWILEQGGKEIKRLEGYQLLKDLNTFSGCNIDIKLDEGLLQRSSF